MTTYVILANNTSQTSSAWTTDKARIATTTAIHYKIGNSAVTAAATDAILPANVVHDEFVGVGNYIAVIRDTANGNISLIEMGTSSSSAFTIS